MLYVDSMGCCIALWLLVVFVCVAGSGKKRVRMETIAQAPSRAKIQGTYKGISMIVSGTK